MNPQEYNKRLKELAENARHAIGELADFIIENKEIGWRPPWGLAMGCLEQIDDIVDNAEIEMHWHSVDIRR